MPLTFTYPSYVPVGLRSTRHAHSTFTPASFTTFAHLLISDLTKSPHSLGVLVWISTPAVASRSTTSGSARMRTTSALSLPTISGGVFAVVNKPCQSSTEKPGIPASEIVGTAGSAGDRLGAVTASARSFPAFTNGIDDGMLAKLPEIWPPTRSAIAGPPPLYGT